jgi:hypothetical protein
MSSSVQARTCFHSLASTGLPARANRVRKTDGLHCTTCSVVCFLARLLLLFSSCLLCRADFIAKGVMLSEIDVELTSQTVVFAFFCLSNARRLLPKLFNSLTNKVCAIERGQVHLDHGKPPWPAAMSEMGPKNETARAVGRRGWRHSQADSAMGRPVLR